MIYITALSAAAAVLLGLALLFLAKSLVSARQRAQQLHLELVSLQSTQQQQEATLQEYKQRLGTLQDQKERLQEQASEDKSEISRLQTAMKAQEDATRQRLRDFEQNEKRLTQQFENIASKIMDSNSRKFSEQNKQSLDHLLTPMKEQLSAFKQKVEDVYDKEAKDRSMLQQELRGLKELNQKISTDAINLTNALKGQNKTQGSWGEMVLERVLERSGLRAGEEYVREQQLQNEQGKRYRPDVIVNLPNDRQVVIDAKTSLSAYEQYVAAEQKEQKSSYLQSHIISIKNHIDALAQKSYEQLRGINTLDFIFMFIPVESALMAALEQDGQLFDYAFKKKIVLVSPTTLLVALRAVENSWRYEKQAQNSAEVVRLAEKLYGKVRGFVEDYEKIGTHLERAQASYDDAHKKLSSGRDNIIRQVEVFKEKSGIDPAKQISKDMADSAMVEK